MCCMDLLLMQQMETIQGDGNANMHQCFICLDDLPNTSVTLMITGLLCDMQVLASTKTFTGLLCKQLHKYSVSNPSFTLSFGFLVYRTIKKIQT